MEKSGKNCCVGVFFVCLFYPGLKKCISTVIIWYTKVISLFPVLEVLAV